MPVLLLGLILGIVLIWWLEKLTLVDRGFLFRVVKWTAIVMLVGWGVFLVLDGRLGALLLLVLAGMIYHYAHHDKAPKRPPLQLPKPASKLPKSKGKKNKKDENSDS